MNIDYFESKLNGFVLKCNEKPLTSIDGENKNQIDVNYIDDFEFGFTPEEDKNIENYISEYKSFVYNLCRNGMGWKLRDIDEMVDYLSSCISRMRREVIYNRKEVGTVNYSEMEIDKMFRELTDIYNKGWEYDYSQRMMQ
ncbi:hypothetical protein [[Clostridium] scindens]|uniref:hypothetical protein n=1 Tax=Clostridium scindens (strain JCM 10418 / VPI 12708) TaxID=29347 RepID=UPI00248DF827|nr:hypothetical protein [[Clostridium] scindens]